MKKIKIGIIGTGVGIRTHLKGFRNLDNAEIVAIVGSSLSRSKEFANAYNIPYAFATYQELCDMPDLDLICVTTPNRFHYEMVSYALKKHKNIICEKPLSDDIGEIKSLINLSKKYDKLCFIDHQLRFNPYILKIKSLIDMGVLGKIYSVRLNQQGSGFAKENAPWNWSFEGESGGGVRLAMASHFTDLIQFWFGAPKPITISGYMNPITKTRKDRDNKERDVLASTICNAQINFVNELTVLYSINAGSYMESRFDISIFGDKAELVFSLQDKLSIYYRDSIGTKKSVVVDGVFEDELENKVSIFSGSFRYLAPKIVRAILSGNASELSMATSFEEAEYNIGILDAIKKSANGATPVLLGRQENKYV